MVSHTTRLASTPKARRPRLPSHVTPSGRVAMGKWCCGSGVANEREEVFSEAAESPQPAGAADTRQQRSSSAPPARSQVIIAQERLHKSSSFSPTASPGGGARHSASSLRYTPQHGIQRDFTNRRDRTKLKAASCADTWSHRCRSRAGARSGLLRTVRA